MLLRHLRPARPSASSPAPTRGRGQSWRYPGGSHARFSSGISPWSGPWWLSPRGDREASSPPVNSRSSLATSAGLPYVPLRQPHPARAASPAARGRAVMHTRREAVPGSSRSPAVGRGGYRPWGGWRGEIPCLQPQNSVILVVPVSPAPSALLPRPPPGGEGSAGRYSVGSRARFFSGISPGRWTVGISPWGGPGRGKPPSPGMQTPGPCEKNRYSALLRVPAIENRCIRAADRAKRRVIV